VNSTAPSGNVYRLIDPGRDFVVVARNLFGQLSEAKRDELTAQIRLGTLDQDSITSLCMQLETDALQDAAQRDPIVSPGLPAMHLRRATA
jgi:hypothetical protein